MLSVYAKYIKKMSNENKTIHDFELQLICDFFSNMERQGPGSPDVTLKALSFIDSLTDKSLIADIGCGTGGQTMVLAGHITGQITGLDLFPDFIDIFNHNAKQSGLQDRVPPAGASPSSAAIVAGMVRSGSRIVVGITAAFPVTISTAIVSPMARPMPRTTPEVIPETEKGITTLYIVCQRVAPNARLASRMARGQFRIASSLTVMIVGSAMIAKTILPANPVSPTGRLKTF